MSWFSDTSYYTSTPQSFTTASEGSGIAANNSTINMGDENAIEQAFKFAAINSEILGQTFENALNGGQNQSQKVVDELKNAYQSASGVVDPIDPKTVLYFTGIISTIGLFAITLMSKKK